VQRCSSERARWSRRRFCAEPADGPDLIPDGAQPTLRSLFDGLPEAVRGLFGEFVDSADVLPVSELRAQIRSHHQQFRNAARSNGLLPLDIADALAGGLEGLLDLHAGLDDRGQRLVIGAARYFISDQDARPDLESVLGLDDDLVVYNWVVAQIGRPELSIDL
jgi:hypothetical protein